MTLVPASGVTVTQTSPDGHCESLVHPPQTFGVENPQVGAPAPVQPLSPVQLPCSQEPARHTYGLLTLPPP
jgi:hypothetical protein